MSAALRLHFSSSVAPILAKRVTLSAHAVSLSRVLVEPVVSILFIKRVSMFAFCKPSSPAERTSLDSASLALPPLLSARIGVMLGVLVVIWMTFWTMGFRGVDSAMPDAAHNVLYVCGDAQVQGVAARRISTQVVYYHAIRNFSAVQYVGNPVGAPCLSAEFGGPISALISCSSPIPAPVIVNCKTTVEPTEVLVKRARFHAATLTETGGFSQPI